MSQSVLVNPTLATIRMVEKALEKEGTLTIPSLKRLLPRQVNHNVLKEVLLYLEESNKIYVGIKGITWFH